MKRRPTKVPPNTREDGGGGDLGVRAAAAEAGRREAAARVPPVECATGVDRVACNARAWSATEGVQRCAARLDRNALPATASEDDDDDAEDDAAPAERDRALRRAVQRMQCCVDMP